MILKNCKRGEIKNMPLKTRAATGIAGLDEVLDGGLSRDHLYLVEGAPGTGKTTMALQFLLAGRDEGEKVLYVALSESRDELSEIAASHGWSLDGIDIYDLAGRQQAVDPEQQYTLFRPSEVELDDVTEAILKQVEEVKPVRIVFDSLAEFRLLAGDPLRYRRQVLRLKHLFTQAHITVVVLDAQQEDASGLLVQSLAHGVLVLDQEARDLGSDRRRMRVIKMRGQAFTEGYHDMRIRTGGLQMWPPLPSRSRIERQGGLIASGIEALDDLLGGGVDQGECTLLRGSPGVGKSSLATQYAVAGARDGQRCAILTFGEHVATFLQRSAGLGMDLQPLIDRGMIEIEEVYPLQYSPGEFLLRVRRAVESGVRMMVIDSVNGIVRAMVQEPSAINYLHDLVAYLRNNGITNVLTVSQPGVLDVFTPGPFDVNTLADTIVLLRYFEARGQVRKAISVTKRRSGTHESTIRELMLGPGIQIGPPLSDFQGLLVGTPTYVGGAEDLMDSEADA